VLLHVSNFRPVKRVWEVVEAFSRIAAKLPAQLYMIGDGPDRPRAEEAARELGIENRVHCLKTISDVEEWYGAADLLLHLRETILGLAPLESACGVPVLAYRVGGLRGEERRGGLDVGDVAAWRRAASNLLRPLRWAAFSSRAPDRRAALRPRVIVGFFGTVFPRGARSRKA
jgi:glycosyltransferase involved in cell wall biosynthesis